MRKFTTRLTRLVYFISLACVIFPWLTRHAKADAKITVTYNLFYHMVSPEVKDYRSSDRTLELILTKKKQIKINFYYQGFQHFGEVKLGVPHYAKTRSGEDFVARWSIERGAIVEANFFDSRVEITRISTNGVDSCSATMENRLARGHRLFESKLDRSHADIKLSEMRDENVRCSIVSIGDTN